MLTGVSGLLGGRLTMLDKLIPCLSLSIVSHGQLHLIAKLLDDLESTPFKNFEVILTLNCPEDEKALDKSFSFPLRVYRNKIPKGFGANHNAAFQHSHAEYFAVVNPDIRLKSGNLGDLIVPMSDDSIGVIAPLVLSPSGSLEDSARKFPTIIRLLARIVGRNNKPDYAWTTNPIEVDWVAGMFLVFRSKYFQKIHGFDEKRYFMYFEDVDICERIWKQGWRVVLQPCVEVIHDAQRASHRSMKHMRWHFISCIRYLGKF